MVTKAKAKTATKTTKTTKSVPSLQPYREPKSVSVEKATNGFVVSTYTDSGRVVKIVKDKKELSAAINSLMGTSK